jgi:FMN phosphatase YigB (HAD superfamily)
MIRALISDLDNTLYAARSVPRATLRPLFDAVRAANQAGAILPEARLEDALEACWDRSFDEVALAYALPAALCQAWAAAAAELEVTEPLQLYPDVSVLWALSLRLFLVTTGYRRLQESKIAALGLADRFDAVYVDALGESIRTGKEGVFRRLLAEQRLIPAEVVVLGDNEDSEIAAGRRLGLWTVQVLRERSVPASTVDRKIRSLHELPGALDQIGRMVRR